MSDKYPKNYRELAMTSEELEGIRLNLGLSVAAFSRCMGMTTVSIHNMRATRQRVRPIVANAARWLLALFREDPQHPSLPAELRAANDNDPVLRKT